MEEKVLVKSEQYDVKKVFLAFVKVGFALGVLVALYFIIFTYLDKDLVFLISVGCVLLLSLIGYLLYLWLSSYELTVTDKRIYGKVAFGKRVDLPVDSISATAITSLFKGVSVSTSSGRISFLVMKNAETIYNTINNLLVTRQSEKKSATATNIPKSDEADQLKKYKDLLDTGVITQEEFDAKKKQLLGL